MKPASDRSTCASPAVPRIRLLVALALLLPGAVSAASYDLGAVFTNPGFESGLLNWNYTGAGVNANTYLTNGEWAAQTWSSSSPFYSDANLAIYYPGKPWGVNPGITHIDQSGIPGDPTTTIVAPVGTKFAGSRQDGYEGHYRRDVNEPPQPAGGFYDTSWQLTSDPVPGPFVSGDTFTLRLWGVRGRLRADWGTENAKTTGSASTLGVRLLGGTFLAGTVSFTNWAADGQWAAQDMTWVLSSNAPSIQIQITGQNKNHDRFVACDAGTSPVPVESTTWSRIKSLW